MSDDTKLGGGNCQMGSAAVSVQPSLCKLIMKDLFPETFEKNEVSDILWKKS